MENLKDFFEKQETKKEAFNIFKVLHDETDERRLHSRFISYLLSSNKEFLQLFVEKHLNINDFDLNSYSVKPDIKDKSEFENIDILIYNDKQAIIIENKIFAGDSNRTDKKNDGYDGQLERYYNTINKGENKDKQAIEIGSKNVVLIFYLTLEGHRPSEESLGSTLTIDKTIQDKPLVTLISYSKEIKEWLDKCIATSHDKDNLDMLTIIKQYQSLILELASDIEQAKENQKLISDNISQAWELQKDEVFTKECFEVLKHVQWHTVADFYNELKLELENIEETKVTEVKTPELKDISKVTHKKNQNSNTRLLLSFKYMDKDLYICNDQKGFTLGNLTDNKWGKFSDILLNEIKLNDFSNEATFKMINSQNRETIVKNIVCEMKAKFDKLENPL